MFPILVLALVMGLVPTPWCHAEDPTGLPPDSELLSAFVSRLPQPQDGASVLWLDYSAIEDTNGDGQILNDHDALLFTDDPVIVKGLEAYRLGDRLTVMGLLNIEWTDRMGRLSYRIVRIEPRAVE